MNKLNRRQFLKFSGGVAGAIALLFVTKSPRLGSSNSLALGQPLDGRTTLFSWTATSDVEIEGAVISVEGQHFGCRETYHWSTVRMVSDDILQLTLNLDNYADYGTRAKVNALLFGKNADKMTEAAKCLS